MLRLGCCHLFSSWFFHFLLIGSLFSIPVTLFPVLFCSHLSCPFPLSHFLRLCFPRQRSRGPRNALSSCAQFLSQTPTHRCQLGDWLSSFPSFSFHSFFSGLAFFTLSISLLRWPLGSTEQNWFPFFHGSWLRQQLCNKDGEREEERACEYVTFVHLCLLCSFVPREYYSIAWWSHCLKNI